MLVLSSSRCRYNFCCPEKTSFVALDLFENRRLAGSYIQPGLFQVLVGWEVVEAIGRWPLRNVEVAQLTSV
jgi:hypothetical protein